MALGGSQGASPKWLTVVGVVKDVKQDSWIDPPSEEIYLPFQQSGDFFAGTARQYTSMTMVVRPALRRRAWPMRYRRQRNPGSHYRGLKRSPHG